MIESIPVTIKIGLTDPSDIDEPKCGLTEEYFSKINTLPCNVDYKENFIALLKEYADKVNESR